MNPSVQRMIEVGIMSAPEISFEIIKDGDGVRTVSFSDGKILYDNTLYDELSFGRSCPQDIFAEPSFGGLEQSLSPQKPRSTICKLRTGV